MQGFVIVQLRRGNHHPTRWAAVIGLEAYRLYRYTGRSYLLHFLFGFVLLGVSYYILALFIAPVGMPVVERGLQWPRLVVQAVAYAMLSLAYIQHGFLCCGIKVLLGRFR